MTLSSAMQKVAEIERRIAGALDSTQKVAGQEVKAGVLVLGRPPATMLSPQSHVIQCLCPMTLGGQESEGDSMILWFW